LVLPFGRLGIIAFKKTTNEDPPIRFGWFGEAAGIFGVAWPGNLELWSLFAIGLRGRVLSSNLRSLVIEKAPSALTEVQFRT
jgi:hypothetical protein